MPGPQFGMIPGDVFADDVLPIEAVAVYGAVSLYANRDRVARPGLDTLADTLRLSRRQVQRHVALLVARGHLERVGGGVGGRAAAYRLTAFDPVEKRRSRTTPDDVHLPEQDVVEGDAPRRAAAGRTFSRQTTEGTGRRWRAVDNAQARVDERAEVDPELHYADDAERARVEASGVVERARRNVQQPGLRDADDDG